MRKLFNKIKKRLSKKNDILSDIHITVLQNSANIKRISEKLDELSEKINNAIPDITLSNTLLELKTQIKGINDYVYNDLKAIVKKSNTQIAGFGFGGYNKENK